MSDRRPTRRTVLTAGAAVVTAVLTGCGNAASTGRVSPGASLTPSPDPSVDPSTAAPPAPTTPPPAAWATEVGGAESRLVATYDAVLKAHPSLTKTLGPLRTAHKRHLAAVQVPATGVAPAQPAGQAEALSRLAVAEQKASTLAAANAVTCPPEAAALLGSIAASDASHVLVLASVGGA